MKQSIIDALNSSKQELEIARKKEQLADQLTRQHKASLPATAAAGASSSPSSSSPSSSLPPPPVPPPSVYDRFTRDHWQDDEYEGMQESARRAALLRRWDMIPILTKMKWENRYSEEKDEYDRQRAAYDTKWGLSSSSAPAPSAAPSSSSSSSSSAAGGPFSIAPFVSKYSKQFTSLLFPSSRVFHTLTFLPPRPAAPPAATPSSSSSSSSSSPPAPSASAPSLTFSPAAVAALSKSTEFFTQYLARLMLSNAESSQLQVLRPEDFAVVLARRPELEWLRWAFAGAEILSSKYKAGWQAVNEARRKKQGEGAALREGDAARESGAADGRDDDDDDDDRSDDPSDDAEMEERSPETQSSSTAAVAEQQHQHNAVASSSSSGSAAAAAAMQPAVSHPASNGSRESPSPL